MQPVASIMSRQHVVVVGYSRSTNEQLKEYQQTTKGVPINNPLSHVAPTQHVVARSRKRTHSIIGEQYGERERERETVLCRCLRRCHSLNKTLSLHTANKILSLHSLNKTLSLHTANKTLSLHSLNKTLSLHTIAYIL